ncbi:hypothetical protein [Arthrobacter globiformis]|uniref:hypothetical protein n=1 Tax=Arthrobacter globiformis TaxID=1665 RepID=UPI000B41FC26|nr:hypothetical protein [Arthrobacter globiformis]
MHFESLSGAGALINWITVGHSDVPLFEDWYNYQHLPERVSTPGFLRARRFIAMDQPDPREGNYLTVYETADISVLSSPEYLRRLNNPTELTQRVIPTFRQFRRAACLVSAVRGFGSSSRILAIELSPEEHQQQLLRTLIADRLLPRLTAEHLLHTGSLLEPDAAVGSAKDSTREGRVSASTQPDSWTILAELQTGVDAQRVAKEFSNGIEGSGIDAKTMGIVGEFQLLYELRTENTAA